MSYTDKQKEDFIERIADANVREKLNENKHLIDAITVPFDLIKRVGINRERGESYLVLLLKDNSEVYAKSI